MERIKFLAQLAKSNINILSVGTDTDCGTYYVYEYQWRKPDGSPKWSKAVYFTDSYDVLDALDGIVEEVKKLRAELEN